eukprot:TRINITY_DN26538_c0_g1_i1.p1 TRINITY_DN26538_c0_g1~~TRINITY_DN26538_c0_g1_i1.p1  ORF type:complete len:339 (+),score=53.40 TRINITY_DN26538_c0_g1_i1:110-1018(+)
MSNNVLPSSAEQQLLSREQHVIQLEEPDDEEDDFEDDDGNDGGRFEALRDYLRDSSNLLQLPKVWRRGNYAAVLYAIPVMVALLSVLSVDWAHECDKPLQIWAVVQVVLQLLSLLINGVVVSRLPRSSLPPDSQDRVTRSLWMYFLLNRIVNFIWFNWFVVGLVWTFEALQNEQCRSSTPFLLGTIYALIVIQLCLVGLLLLAFCFSCLFVILRARFFPNARLVTSPGASEQDIRKLKTRKYRAGVVAKEDASCAICLSEYARRDRLRFLPCRHHFHAECVDRWLLTTSLCPVCKQDIRAQR